MNSVFPKSLMATAAIMVFVLVMGVLPSVGAPMTGTSATSCVTRALSNKTYNEGGSDHAVWLPQISTNLIFFPEPGSLVELGDGTALLTGTVRSLTNLDSGFVITVTFTGHTTAAPPGSPMKELDEQAYVDEGGPVDPSTWRYYTAFTGTFTGFGIYSNGVLEVVRYGPAFQIGVGASGKNINLGASGWFTWTVTQPPAVGSFPMTGRGDFNVDLGVCECPACDLLYPFPSTNPLTKVTFNRNQAVKAFSTNFLGTGDSIKLWYNEPDTLPLGIRQVIIKTSSGRVTNNFVVTPMNANPGSAHNVQVGSLDAKDSKGRPIFPAIFITELTNGLTGDWQFGGTAYPPHAIFGSWKSAVQVIDQTKSPPEIEIRPDGNPARNNWNLGSGASAPPGLLNEGYGTEVRWNVSQLPMLPGRTYRVQFIVHDGDPEDYDGDAGQACTILCITGCPPPVVTGPAEVTVPCIADVPPPDINTITIEASTPPATVTWLGDITNTLNCVLSIRRTYRITDECSSTNWTQWITVRDTIPPTLLGGPALTNECGGPLYFTKPVVWDDCDGTNVTLTSTIVTNHSGAGCPSGYSVVCTWTATDRCGNSASSSQTIYYRDTTPPVLTCELNLVVECGTRWVFVPPSGLDNCNGTNVTIQAENTITNLGCGTTFIAQRIWRGFDSCSNSATITQTVAVVDTAPPVMSCASNLVIQAGATWNFSTPGAYDTCDGANVVLTVLSTVTNPAVVCPTNLMVTRTWRAMDQCGNFAACSQTITVIDTNPPVLSCASNLVIECGLPLVFTPPVALDNADGTNVLLRIVRTVTNLNVLCPTNLLVTRTWSATDRCGNSNICSQTIAVRDTLPPAIVCGADETLECGTFWRFSTPSAYDICEGTNVQIAVVSTVTNRSIACPTKLIATRIWSAADRCGNSNTCSQTITVMDTTPPVITCATNLVLQSGTAWNFTVPSAFDICDSNNVTITLVNTVTNPMVSCPTNLVVTRTWRAADQCTNVATCSQTITIIDTTPPVLTCGSNIVIECGLPLTFTPPAVFDNRDGTNLPVVVVNTVTNTGLLCPLRYRVTRTWSATDRCGNSNTCSQTITVRDTTPPIISCNSNLVVQWGSAWSFTFPSAYDLCDGTNVSITVVSTTTNGPVNCPTNLVVTRTWRVADQCTNWTTCSQTITIIDTTPPVLTCGSNTVSECGWPLVFTQPAAFDNCEGTNVSMVVVSTVTNANGVVCPARYRVTRTWSATDRCGNSNTCSQTITVVDRTPPLISCVATQTVECGTIWDFTRPSVSDLCDGVVPVTVVTTTTNSTGLVCPVRYTVTRVWRATDLCTNSSTCTQTVAVLDTAPPLMICYPDRTNACDEPVIFDTPLAYDLCEGSLAPIIVSTRTNFLQPPGAGYTVVRTWKAVDSCTNAATCSQSITVTPCPPEIIPSIEVACLLPNNTCGVFGPLATGIRVGATEPAFCYRLIISNSSSVALTNCTVLDDRLGDLTRQFFPTKLTVFPPHASLSYVLKTNWPIHTTNILVASGQSVVDGRWASGSDNSLVTVLQAGIACRAVAYSPSDQDGVPYDEFVTLPDDGQKHPVAFYLLVQNTGNAHLTNVRISTPALNALGCYDPPAFSLPAYASYTNALCMANLSCTASELRLIPQFTAQVDDSNGQCSYDMDGKPMPGLLETNCVMGIRACVPVESCRVTGGGRQETTFPVIAFTTHGGQVGAPVGMAGFDPDSECIQGNWEVVRHEGGGIKGNFHTKSFDSLMCACLSCDGGVGAVLGELCNPGETDCGPGPRKAPANKIAFSGVGDFTLSKGSRRPRSVLFRVDIEDRGEPGNNGKGKNNPPDRHRIRIWILTDAELARLENPNDRLLEMRRAIAATDATTVLQDGAVGSNGLALPNGSVVFGVRQPDIDDGGEMDTGNHQIHPMIKSCF